MREQAEIQARVELLKERREYWYAVLKREVNPQWDVEELDAASEKLACLDPEDAWILVHRRLGLTQEEIAERLGMAQQTVSWKIKNILNVFQNSW